MYYAYYYIVKIIYLCFEVQGCFLFCKFVSFRFRGVDKGRVLVILFLLQIRHLKPSSQFWEVIMAVGVIAK